MALYMGDDHTRYTTRDMKRAQRRRRTAAIVEARLLRSGADDSVQNRARYNDPVLAGSSRRNGKLVAKALDLNERHKMNASLRQLAAAFRG